MNFDISEEQQLFQDSIKRYLDRALTDTKRREVFNGETGFDEVVWRDLMGLGLGAVALSEEYGGAGLELIDLALGAEVLGYMAAPGPFLGHVLAGLAVQLGGSSEQKSRWLPQLAAGEIIGTVAFDEADNAWQPEEWALEGDRTLKGAKRNVLYAERAQLIVVGTRGGGLGLVESGAKGIEIVPIDGVDRTRRLAHVSFDNTPCEPLPGGADVAARVRDAGLCLLAADAFGGGTRCIEMAVEYAKTREQFGVTIGHFQALKHQLANMAIEIEPARGLYWYAAHAFDRIPAEAAQAAALAKAHLTDRFMQVARDATEAHGGIAYTWEFDLQIWFKRAMFDRTFFGTPAVHRERVAQLAGW